MKRRIPVLMMAALLLTGCGNAGGASADGEFSEKPGKKSSLFRKSKITLDKGTGVLTLSGDITAEDVQAYKDNESVKSVVCKNGTVFPEACKELFKSFHAESIDLTNADTSQVKSMASMFLYCTYMTSLNLGGIDTSGVEDMNGMFSGCDSLTTILVSYPWNTYHAKGSDQVFAGCEKLVGGNGTIFDPEHTDWTYACVDTPETPGYLTLAE